MAAYAALVSLMNTLLNIHHHHRFSNSLHNKQVQSLRHNLDFLLDFIESNNTHSQSDQAQVLLETQIASAAFAAENVVESHIVDQIHAGSISLLDLHTVIQHMDSVKEKVLSAKEERGFKEVHPRAYSSPFSTSSTPRRMVGLDDELTRLLDELTGNRSTLQIIPIDGMGGIGKTTLARNVYENPLIVQHFDFRAWVTVSQQYSVRDIFSKLLSCESGETSEHELGERLYKRLIGRRYFIILDDIWSIEAWDSIRRFFPDNNSRSRVVVTTRLSSIATQFGASSFRLGFLDENKSWELFCENAFPGEGCPPDLEGIGNKISKKCKGLPLLIVVIGALLRKSSVEYWENISKNMNSILNSGEQESLDILSLSYMHLPAHLKPCFLYMGTLAEDDEIIVSELIKLWVAEGFVKPSKTLSLEEVAEDYVKDLIDRNLILNRKKGFDEDVEFCSIHDLLRDLCIEKAHKENFLCVMRVGNIRQGIDTARFFVFNQGTVSKLNYRFRTLELACLARSSASSGNSMSNKFKMLRILNAPDCYYVEDYILKQVNLRYISIFDRLLHKKNYVYLHSSISLLWNLQTLIIQRSYKIIAPIEIWEMPQLRHVIVNTIWIPDPPLDCEFVLRNLQTLESISYLRLTDEVCKRIPNVKRLRVFCKESNAKRIASFDFGRLPKLESLRFEIYGRPGRVYLVQNLTFPSLLQELSLKYCGLHWEDLSMIGLLPHLRVLKLGGYSVIGAEWNPVEGEFLCLRFLKLSFCDDLFNWNADKPHFPVLEKLVVHELQNLNEIPPSLGEIPTLVEIKLYNCSESSSVSAVKILDEQENLGNEGLQVQIGFLYRHKLERFKEKIEQFESSRSKNLQLWSLQ